MSMQVADLWVRRFPHSVRTDGFRMHITLGLDLCLVSVPKTRGLTLEAVARTDLYCLPIFAIMPARWMVFASMTGLPDTKLAKVCEGVGIRLRTGETVNITAPGHGDNRWRRNLLWGEAIPPAAQVMRLALEGDGHVH